jgi:hypothetical protein
VYDIALPHLLILFGLVAVVAVAVVLIRFVLRRLRRR